MHAVGVREGELHAVGFDIGTLAVHGRPVSVIDSVFRAQDQGAAYFAVAQNGTLIFTPGGYARTLVRVDRHGRRYANPGRPSGVPVSGCFAGWRKSGGHH